MELLPLNTKIAGKKTVEMWNEIRKDLDNFDNVKLWNQSYNDFFIERIKERYLKPIESIQKHDCENGEGFAIMTIICSLIEFLESTYEGLNYKYDKPINKYEYTNKSMEFFISFLTKRLPVEIRISNELAEQFYYNVRCGLLHEAKTCGNWVIKNENITGLIIEETRSNIIVFRNNFYNAINEYIDCQYKTELLASKELKLAFLRKFDRLCKN